MLGQIYRKKLSSEAAISLPTFANCEKKIFKDAKTLKKYLKIQVIKEGSLVLTLPRRAT